MRMGSKTAAAISMVTILSLLIQTASAQVVVATVDVGNGPQGVAYDSGKGEVFVTNAADNTVSVISDSSNTVVATLTPFTESYYVGVAYDAAKGEVFVASSGTGSVVVISDISNTVVGSRIPVCGKPQAVAYDSGRGEVFVTCVDSSSVWVISDSSNTVVGSPIPVGTNPQGVAYDSDRGEVFVTNFGSNSVSVISDSSNTVVATVTLTVNDSPLGVAYDSGKAEVFVANGRNAVYVISAPLSICVSTAAGGATACGAASSGALSGFSAVSVGSLSPPPPSGLTFPFGLFTITQSGLSAGQTVTVTITLSSPLPAGTFSYWKFQGGSWSQFPSASLDSSRTVITLTFTADSSGTVDDPGGPAISTTGAPIGAPIGGLVESVNKFAVLAPWLVLIGLVGCIGAVIVLVRKYQS